MTWVIRVERPIPIEQVILRYKSAVYIAILKVDGMVSIMLDMRNLFAGKFTDRSLEDKQLTMAEQNPATFERRMAFWLPIQHAGHLLIVSSPGSMNYGNIPLWYGNRRCHTC